MRWVWRALLNGDVTQSRHLAQRADGGIRAMRFAEQSKAVQLLQPLAIENVGFSCLDVAHALGIDQPHVKAACLQKLIQRYPVHPRRFECDGVDTASAKPIGYRDQVLGVRTKFAHRRLALAYPVRRYRNIVALPVDVDSGQRWDA